MLKMALILLSLSFMSCSHLQKNSSNDRAISSVSSIDPNQMPPIEWHFVTTTFQGLNYVYTPFFIKDEKNLTLYTAGGGTAAGNGIRKLSTDLFGTKAITEKMVIPTGPDAAKYNYFRAGRVSKNGSELYMLTEIAGCYEGCDTPAAPKSMATYHSLDDGNTWTFVGFVNVDGKRYVSQWMAQTGLVWNPNGSKDLDLKDLTNNKFITIGENRDMFVSNDGVNFKSIKMNHPFPKDRLVFASLAKTPFGFHMMTCANWSDRYYTMAVRHLFSKDLVNWYPIESSTFLKNPQFYKG
ncbi:MAG: hypothetical protein H7177_13915, partial [Rhizobacter sp.]|nr:hypothetical protein [Bacteriovorax sp.]